MVMIEASNVKEYLQAYLCGKAGYTQEGLRSLDWRNANLEWIDLSHLDLEGVDMSNANLQNADLSYANLRNAILTNANLSNAVLRHTQLEQAKLDRADLSYANLEYSDLTNATLLGVKLTNALLRGAELVGAEIAIDGVDVPFIWNIDSCILEQLKTWGRLNMSNWTTDERTYCRAMWAIHLAGVHGYILMEKVGIQAAAALLYWRSGSHPVPDWYDDNEAAIKDMECRSGSY